MGLETTLPCTEHTAHPRIPAHLCQANGIPGTPKAGRKPSDITKGSVVDPARDYEGEQRTTRDALYTTSSIRQLGEDMDQPT
jgi:hypothetical protein